MNHLFQFYNSITRRKTYDIESIHTSQLKRCLTVFDLTILGIYTIIKRDNLLLINMLICFLRYWINIRNRNLYFNWSSSAFHSRAVCYYKFFDCCHRINFGRSLLCWIRCTSPKSWKCLYIHLCHCWRTYGIRDRYSFNIFHDDKCENRQICLY